MSQMYVAEKTRLKFRARGPGQRGRQVLKGYLGERYQAHQAEVAARYVLGSTGRRESVFE